MTAINYHNRIFKSVENSASGEVDGATRFHYRQQDDLIWATYAGGAIRLGTLVGTVAADGTLEFGYQHVNQQGRHMRGQCRSTPLRLPDGRIRLYEKWQWLTLPDASHANAAPRAEHGESVIEEIDTAPATEPDGGAPASKNVVVPALGSVGELRLQVLSPEFAICRLSADTPMPDWASAAEWSAITRTQDELSIVCAAEHVPAAVQTSRGWRMLQVEGPLGFGETGIMARLATPLARAAIPVFVISTYDTDYLLVPEAALARAVDCLNRAVDP